MTKELLITDIFTELTEIVGKLSQETFSQLWLNQGASYLRTIKSQNRQPTIPVWENLLASLLQHERVITTKNNHPLLKQKAQQIRSIAERLATYIAHKQIQSASQRHEARMLMLKAVKKAVASYDGTYTDDAPPISIGF